MAQQPPHPVPLQGLAAPVQQQRRRFRVVAVERLDAAQVGGPQRAEHAAVEEAVVSGIQTFRGFAPPRGAVRWAGGETQTADRHADLPRAARAGLLLRRQDALHPAPARRRQALLPVAAPPVRQEPVPGYAEGAVRGQRRAVRGAAHPRRPRLVTAPSGGAAELRRRQLHGAGECKHEWSWRNWRQ